MSWIERHKERLFLFGRPLSPAYAAAMRLRALLYARGVFRRHRVDRCTMSIGNITLGGTGKTPLVRAVIEWSAAAGMVAGVVSRGYGGRASGPLTGKGEIDPILYGDEPAMLSRLTGAPVAVGSRRSAAASLLVQRYGPDLVILDDGFQHMALHRDIDLCLLDYQRPFGNSKVFPGGDLREPVSALGRAHAVVLTRAPALDAPVPDALAKGFRGPIFVSILSSKGIVGLWEELPQQVLEEGRAAAFCGIGNGASFVESLGQAGIVPVATVCYGDHHAYTAEDVKALEQKARNNGANFLVTTWKDAVKLRRGWFSMPVAVLDVRAEVEPMFWRWLDERIRVHMVGA